MLQFPASVVRVYRLRLDKVIFKPLGWKFIASGRMALMDFLEQHAYIRDEFDKLRVEVLAVFGDEVIDGAIDTPCLLVWTMAS